MEAEFKYAHERPAWKFDLQQFGPGAIGAGVSGAGDILGIIESLNQMNAQKNATNQLSGDLSNAVGAEGGASQQMIASYLGTTLPELQAVIKTLGPQQQQAWNAAMGTLGAATGTAMNDPYIGKLSGIGDTLANWNGLSPQQLNALTMQGAGAGLTAAKTMNSQAGGVPNEALAFQNAVGSANQAGQQGAVQLGAQAMQDRLNALTGAASAYGNASGQQLNQAGTLAGIGSTEGGMANNAMDSILSALGISSGAGQMGMAGLGNVTNTYGNLLETLMGQKSAGGGLAGLFGGLGTSLTSLFGGKGSPSTATS
jgi:hypothetical protein